MEPSPWRHLAVAWNGLKNGNRLQPLTIRQERPPAPTEVARLLAAPASTGGPDAPAPAGRSSAGRAARPADSRSSSTWPAVRAISHDRVHHRRQRRVGHRRDRPVVVADQRNVPGHGPAGRPEHAQRPHRHQVIRDEDGVQIGMPLEQALVAAAPPGVVKSPCSTASAGRPRSINASATRQPVDGGDHVRPARQRCRSAGVPGPADAGWPVPRPAGCRCRHS